MAHLERDAHPALGAKFYRDGDAVMFRFVIDTGNVIGPRTATKADQGRHPDAWASFDGADNFVTPTLDDVASVAEVAEQPETIEVPRRAPGRPRKAA